MADPAPTPAKMTPFAKPRSWEGIQLATNRLDAGNSTASPAPSEKRTASSTSNTRAMPADSMAVRAVKTPHQSVPSVRMRRGPKRSARRPAGA